MKKQNILLVIASVIFTSSILATNWFNKASESVSSTADKVKSDIQYAAEAAKDKFSEKRKENAQEKEDKLNQTELDVDKKNESKDVNIDKDAVTAEANPNAVKEILNKSKASELNTTTA